MSKYEGETEQQQQQQQNFYDRVECLFHAAAREGWRPLELYTWWRVGMPGSSTMRRPRGKPFLDEGNLPLTTPIVGAHHAPSSELVSELKAGERFDVAIIVNVAESKAVS